MNNVTIAGLCHDLGHGPFSHVFEHGFMQIKYPSQNWHHEDMSIKMLYHLIDENHIDKKSEDIVHDW